MIYILRHGERADYGPQYEKDKIELSFDPHLTDLGKLQAYYAGETIKSLTKQAYEKNLLKTDKVKYLVVSSPFLRCIQTSYHVIQALGQENVLNKTIYLEEAVCEHLSSNYFKTNPLPQLLSRTKIQEVQKKYVDFDIQDGLVEKGTYLYTPKYPETYDTFDERKEAIRAIIEHYATKINKDEDIVLVIATHGWSVEAFLEDHGLLDDYDIRYTCLNQLLYDPTHPKKGKVLVHKHHDQLKIAEEKYKSQKDNKDEKVIV